MSVKSALFGSGASNDEIDLIDLGAVVMLPFVAGLIYGVWTWQIDVFGTYGLMDSLWVIFGANITPALLLALASVGWVGLTNLANQRTEMTQREYGVMLTAILLPLLYVFIPSVKEIVTVTDLGQLAALLYTSVAAAYVSFKA